MQLQQKIQVKKNRQRFVFTLAPGSGQILGDHFCDFRVENVPVAEDDDLRARHRLTRYLIRTEALLLSCDRRKFTSEKIRFLQPQTHFLDIL